MINEEHPLSPPYHHLIQFVYWGISNYAGEEIIPCRYDKIEYDGENKLRLFYDSPILFFYK